MLKSHLNQGFQITHRAPKADHSLFAALDPAVSVPPTVPLLSAFCVQLLITELVRPGSLLEKNTRRPCVLVAFVMHNQQHACKCLTTDSPEKEKKNPDI